MNLVGTAFARGFPRLNRVDYQQHSIAIQGYQMKICMVCHQEKPGSDFGKDSSRKDGLCFTCKSCRKIGEAKSYQRRKLHKADYRIKNKIKARKHTSEWGKRNPEKKQLARILYRAKKINALGVLSIGLRNLLFAHQKGLCACCKIDLSKTKAHLDHIYPLASGGSNDDSNMQLLCQGCNCSKGSKDPIEFMQSRGFLL